MYNFHESADLDLLEKATIDDPIDGDEEEEEEDYEEGAGEDEDEELLTGGGSLDAGIDD